MPGIIVSDSEMPKLLGLAQTRIYQFVAEGCPVVTGDNNHGDNSEGVPFDPQRCTKRDIARCFGVKLSDLDRWVRNGCPCESTGKVRAPLVFNMPQVWRWYYVHRSYEQGGDEAGRFAKKEVRIWNLELTLEVGPEEAERILGPAT